jgi:hypothetical protein
VVEEPIDHAPHTLTEVLPHLYNVSYRIHQGRCYQQHSPNLCGYHAIFNTFCFLKLLQGGPCEYNIENAGSFWKFKIKVENFLLGLKEKHKLPDTWPWRERDIREGDFERTHNLVCMERFGEFRIFREQNQFIFLSHTWQFQYQNLILEGDSKR